MLDDIVVGIDPGGMQGVGIWGAHGRVDSWQGELWPCTVRLIQFAREHRPRIVRFCIEDSFLGAGPHASLQVAERAGQVRGALRCAGFNALMNEPSLWRPKTSEWRSKLGIKGKRDAAEAQARLWMGSILKRTFTVAQTHEAEALCMAHLTWTEWARNHARREHIAADGGRS